MIFALWEHRVKKSNGPVRVQPGEGLKRTRTVGRVHGKQEFPVSGVEWGI